jgi:hypothetical protein
MAGLFIFKRLSSSSDYTNVSKNKFIFIILALLGAFLLFFAGTITGRSSELRKSEGLAERITELHREDRDRQQRITELVGESIVAVDRARETTERIAVSSGAAKRNIREAIGLIEQAEQDYKNLQDDLNNLRASIVGIGSVNSKAAMEIEDDHRKD